ncbi:hypothetical protein WJM97_04995 [Okeanomitos corallinicola TIOX110]|uniref:Uncharacterized protein n=1 Tax=Okeanomitos corallinicola TIOX110 TaxID=3133117 RepID=A0ABZ2UUQ6_9CYAN
MLRGNTRKQLINYPHKQSGQLVHYQRRPLTYYPQKKLNYYHLISAFVVGLIGGYLINSLYQHYHAHNLVESRDAVTENAAHLTNVADTSIKIDKQKAFNSVWNLAQVQRKAKEIKNLSKGAISVSATVADYPSENKPFYVVKVFENHPDKTTSPVYWFRVSSSSGVIEPLDLVENKYIDIEEWNPDGR